MPLILKGPVRQADAWVLHARAPCSGSSRQQRAAVEGSAAHRRPVGLRRDPTRSTQSRTGSWSVVVEETRRAGTLCL